MPALPPPSLPPSSRDAQARALEQGLHFLERGPIEVARYRVLERAERVAVTDGGLVRFFHQGAVNKAGAEGVASADAVHDLELILDVVVEFSVGIGDSGPGVP